MFEVRHSFDELLKPAKKWRIQRLDGDPDLLRGLPTVAVSREYHPVIEWPGQQPGTRGRSVTRARLPGQGKPREIRSTSRFLSASC